MNLALPRKHFHFYFLLLQQVPKKNNIQQPILNLPLHGQDDFREFFGAKGVRYSMATQILLKLHNAISGTYRQYIGIGNISALEKDISFIKVSAIYRDWLHSLCTHSAGKFLRVASTSGHVCLLFDKL